MIHYIRITTLVHVTLLTCSICTANQDFEIRNDSRETIWCAVMYYMPKGIHFEQPDRNGWRAIDTNKEVRWRIEGWWQIEPGKSKIVYVGNQKYVLVHVRNARGQVRVPREYDRAADMPAALDDFFETDAFEGEKRVIAKWKRKAGDDWNIMNYRVLGELYRSKATKWSEVRFYEVPVADMLKISGG